MFTLMTDRASVTGARRTADGYLVGDAKVARVGVQQYLGRELGRPDLSVVRVYRPAEEVFRDATMRSFAHRPVTLDHPGEMVDSSNWRKVAAGQVGDQVVRDGEFVRVPLVLMDADAIRAWESGKRELSMGYTAEIVFGDGVTPDGEHYDAKQVNIMANHLAIVDVARGGPQLRLDAAPAQIQAFDSDAFRARMLDQFKDAKHLTHEQVQGFVDQLTANAAAGQRLVAAAAAQKAASPAFADQYRQHREVCDTAYADMCARLQAGPQRR
ncbi:DUF2213 domain-containing protein [Pseudoxanthomonas winnipegensis]|uniref:DUF2213 domain-containing protein n=1 Tax=Pseudoxanthomonas winnipegensis TaxID=2480810 RepID=UPI002577896A|nr:DUF2213 domain-containing protein [Pseudoxanthomonas winnipegensis]WJI14943.1 DUF2213 domain-containing protein [Pseudoxanthomonas winnipegensis]